MRTDRVSKVLFLNLFLFINCISRSDCSDLLLTPLLEFLLSSQYLLGVLTPSHVRLRIKLLYDLSVGKVHSLLIALTIISELTLSSLSGTGTF